MAELVKIRSSKNTRINNSVKMFIDNEEHIIRFNEDAIAEVKEEIVIGLLEIDSSLEIIDKDVKDRIQVNQAEKEGKDIILLQKKVGSLEGNIVNLKKTNEELLKENGELKERVKDLEEALSKSNNDDNGDEDKEKLTKYSLRKMELEDLQAIALKAELPEKEWKDYKKTKLVDYLLDKINA